MYTIAATRAIVARTCRLRIWLLRGLHFCNCFPLMSRHRYSGGQKK